MSKIASTVRNFVREEEGATMVEYALIVAAIALIVVVGAKVFGNSASAKFNSMAGQMT
jgi:pilus assembly protein Flp/PilA